MKKLFAVVLLILSPNLLASSISLEEQKCNPQFGDTELEVISRIDVVEELSTNVYKVQVTGGLPKVDEHGNLVCIDTDIGVNTQSTQNLGASANTILQAEKNIYLEGVAYHDTVSNTFNASFTFVASPSDVSISDTGFIISGTFVATNINLNFKVTNVANLFSINKYTNRINTISSDSLVGYKEILTGDKNIFTGTNINYVIN